MPFRVYILTDKIFTIPQFVQYRPFRGVDTKEEVVEPTAGKAGVKKDQASASTDKRIRLIRRDVAKSQEIVDEPFSIGNFFRLLIIAAIIIALVVLLGGQALQISKGSD